MNFRNCGSVSAKTAGPINLGLRWEVIFSTTEPKCVMSSVDTTAFENPPMPNGNSIVPYPLEPC